MKRLFYILLLLVCTYLGYWVGCQTWYKDVNYKLYHYNTEEARLSEVKYCNSMIEALHWYYRNDTALWNETFRNTQEYKNIELINQGDWEDFYSPDWK